MKTFYGQMINEDGNRKFFFDEDGNLEGVCVVENEMKHGQYIGYFPSGNIRCRGYYEDDVKVGEWYYFFDEWINGEVVEKDYKCNKVFMMGNRNEKIEKYDNDGRLEGRITLHKNGKIKKKTILIRNEEEYNSLDEIKRCWKVGMSKTYYLGWCG